MSVDTITRARLSFRDNIFSEAEREYILRHLPQNLSIGNIPFLIGITHITIEEFMDDVIQILAFMMLMISSLDVVGYLKYWPIPVLISVINIALALAIAEDDPLFTVVRFGGTFVFTIPIIIFFIIYLLTWC